MTRTLSKRDALIEASRFDDGVQVLGLRAGDGTELSDEKRKQMLAAVMAGEHVELELELLAYEQKPDARNRKNIRIRDGAMMAFGQSGKGKPFLRDHDQHSVMSRGGTIVKSSTEKRGDGDYVVKQTARLAAPWACELALRGLLDTLSVGIYPTGTVRCSVHGTEVFEHCYCFRGDEMELEDGEKTVVEWIYDSAENVETSAVNVPAVPSAHIESIRSALMLSAGENPGGHTPQRNLMTLSPKLCTILGIAATAGEADALTAAEALKADRAELAIVKAELGTANAELKTLRSDKVKGDEDAFIAGGVKRGAIALGADADALREFFQLAPDRAKARVAARPDGYMTPVGLKQDSAPAALDPKDLPANQRAASTDISKLSVEEQDAAIDAALRDIHIDPAKVRGNLTRAGLSAVDIRKELLAMSAPGGN